MEAKIKWHVSWVVKASIKGKIINQTNENKERYNVQAVKLEMR